MHNLMAKCPVKWFYIFYNCSFIYWFSVSCEYRDFVMFRIERRRLTKPSLLHPGEHWCSACRSLSQLSACICPWPFWSRNGSTPLDVLRRYKKDALNLHWLSLYLFGGLFVCVFCCCCCLFVHLLLFFWGGSCSKGMPFYSSCSFLVGLCSNPVWWSALSSSLENK